MARPFQGAAAIVGIGQTDFLKDAGRSETRLAFEAIVAALADSGLGTDDVDGLVSYTIDPIEETDWSGHSASRRGPRPCARMPAS